MATVSREQFDVPTKLAGSRSSGSFVAGETLLTLRLSGEMNQAIEILMRRTSLPKADVLNMAIGLLRVAIEAADQGKRVGIAGAEADLEVEFKGF